MILVASLLSCSGHAALHADLPPEPTPPFVPIREQPAWVFRRLSTGAVRRQSDLTTETLTFSGDHATLTINQKSAPSGAMLGETIAGPWVDTSTKKLSGLVQNHQRGTVELTLRDGSDALDLLCGRQEVRVAAATAVRIRSSDDSECGDQGTWEPAATTPVSAWVCHAKPTNPDDVSPVEYTFGEAPGIEFLFVNDDCIIQGGGLRRVPSDGSVSAIRGKRRVDP